MLFTRTTDLVRRRQTARQNLTLAQDTAKLDLLILDESQLTHSFRAGHYNGSTPGARGTNTAAGASLCPACTACPGRLDFAPGIIGDKVFGPVSTVSSAGRHASRYRARHVVSRRLR